MKKAGGILGLIGGVFGVFAALFTLFFGGLASAFSASGASTVVGLGWGGLAFSFLVIILGAVCLVAESKWPAAMLTLGSILGAVLGGTAVAICMVLGLVGGILALAGTRSSPGARKGRGWAIGGGLMMAVVVALMFVGGGKHGSRPAASVSAATAASVPAPASAAVPQFKLGETFQGRTFRITVASAEVIDAVGDSFMRSTPAVGGEYVAVAWTYTNISNAPVEPWKAPRLKLIDPAGHVYDADLGASGAFAAQVNANAKVLSNVNPGITIRDADVFEVSRTLFDASSWKLRVRSQDGDALVTLAAVLKPQSARPGQAAAPVRAAPEAMHASAPMPAASRVPAEGQDVALAGTILTGHDTLASGVYTYFHADTAFASPCNGSSTQDMLLWNPSVGDPQILKGYAGQHVVLHGEINCPGSGIQFAPDSASQP